MTFTENTHTASDVAEVARWSDYDVTSSVDDNGVVTLTHSDGSEFWLSDDRWAGSAGWTWTTVTPAGEQVESSTEDDDHAQPLDQLKAWLRGNASPPGVESAS